MSHCNLPANGCSNDAWCLCSQDEGCKAARKEEQAAIASKTKNQEKKLTDLEEKVREFERKVAELLKK